MGDIIEVLPRDRVVLEILERGEMLWRVCKQLKEAGYTLALDDVVHLTE
jgi:c-di-GMP-related signal transduction protein